MLSNARDVYVKNIWIDGTGFRSEKSMTGKLEQLKFFPEGGHLFADQLNLIVFRSIDASGNPVSVRGSILTIDGQMIAPFQTTSPGIGTLRFKPRSDVQYRAVVDSGGGTFSLPTVLTGAIQLQVESERGGKKFQLSKPPKLKLANDAFRLTATTHGQIVYDQDISFGGYPSLIGHLLTDSLPSGILLFELFDGDGKLLLKRPCFIDRKEWQAPVSLNQLSSVGGSPTDSTRFQLILSDSVMSSVSISVMNADRMLPDESILSRLM